METHKTEDRVPGFDSWWETIFYINFLCNIHFFPSFYNAVN